MLIGIDFDNTIADYGRVFASAAEEQQLLSFGYAKTKLEVKAAVWALSEGERTWMQLQGCVYGKYMHKATMYKGVADFFNLSKECGIDIAIISHKTEFGHFESNQFNLRDTAREWMVERGFFDANGFGIDPDRVFFESTRDGKIARIDSLRCDHFVDDLAEVLMHAKFPLRTQAHLFAPDIETKPMGKFIFHKTWSSITECLINAC